ncbi:putative ABC transport system ATP-binding protein [Desulfosalsimonas propionicica]|uniref:Putative ABC transport system ATP-binding protein n=1 Tax=Desulfosalsimonas propionicica TaxID=332175 RepID=A0A7W0HL45_9BACT|nr:ABC transporter ATP-binding protein [Desulfosalsimonas propionicica]MBA2881868.1 putative ABC transport system ATP-binding protein [Desulfosalsimonas propionicica]
MALVKTIGIRKDYRLGEATVHALRGVNIQIDPGEFVAVWGPSGSGKTTLLNLIGAIDEPTEGEIFLNGRKLNALSDNERTEVRNRSIGFIFQNFNLIPVLSALENVMLPLQISGESYSRAKKTAGSRLEEVGLSRFIHHRPDNLSGGQSQRVAIARALIGTPVLVIADEPTANLDSETSDKIITLMREINQKGKTTFIFSTHDRRLLEHCDRLIEISDGRISEKEQS